MKELLVFDLDGTLMNKNQQLSLRTRQVLTQLKNRKVHFTIATGRTRSTAEPCYQGFKFDLPQIYKNGANVWDPATQSYPVTKHLDNEAALQVLELMHTQAVNSFVFAMDSQLRPCYWYREHPSLVEQPNKLHGILQEVQKNQDHQFWSEREAGDFDNNVINMLAVGDETAVTAIADALNRLDRWAVHYGPDMYYPGQFWLDVHHKDVSKGQALEQLKAELGYDRIIAFGDGSNDQEMFEIADEAYATANASPELQSIATEVIGHHDQDAIATFLTERYNL